MSTTAVRRCGCASAITIAFGDGIYYPLTPCCAATGKGSVDGTVCRSCYDLVDDAFGGFATDETSARRLLDGLGCSTPADCAVQVLQ